MPPPDAQPPVAASPAQEWAAFRWTLRACLHLKAMLRLAGQIDDFKFRRQQRLDRNITDFCRLPARLKVGVDRGLHGR